MTKAHLIEMLAEKAPTLSRRQAELVVNTLFDSIRDSLKRGKKPKFGGLEVFGYEFVRPRKAGILKPVKRCRFRKSVCHFLKLVKKLKSS